MSRMPAPLREASLQEPSTTEDDADSRRDPSCARSDVDNTEIVLTSAGGRGQAPKNLSWGPGGFEWMLKANDPDSRHLRKEIAQQTMHACRLGSYTLDGNLVVLKGIQSMTDGTKTIRRSHLTTSSCAGVSRVRWKKQAPGLAMDAALEAAGVPGTKVALVNAASSYSVCGGFFVGGRHALEESFCISTTLHMSLKLASRRAAVDGVGPPACAQPPRQKDGSKWDYYIPEDGVVLSPCVEVFRGTTFEGYSFLESPVMLAAVISVGLPNANERVRDAPVDKPDDIGDYRALLTKKFIALASAAQSVGARVLVMPDAGCGVYNNPREEVGKAFGSVIFDHFRHAFDEIHLVGDRRFCDVAEACGAGRPPVLGPPSFSEV